MEDSHRKDAMLWWNSLSGYVRSLQALMYYYNRTWESLTGREIEYIYKAKHNIKNKKQGKESKTISKPTNMKYTSVRENDFQYHVHKILAQYAKDYKLENAFEEDAQKAVLKYRKELGEYFTNAAKKWCGAQDNDK